MENSKIVSDIESKLFESEREKVFLIFRLSF